MINRIIVYIILVLVFFDISPVLADFNCLCNDGSKSVVSACTSCCSGSPKSCTAIGNATSKTTSPIGTGGNVTMPDPMRPGGGDPLTVSQLIGRMIQIVLGVVGSFGLALFTYAGLLWMSAAGSPDRIDKAKKVMIWTAIGMIIIFTAYALVATILGAVGAA